MKTQNTINTELVHELSTNTGIDLLFAILSLGDNPEMHSAEIIMALSQQKQRADTKLAAYCKMKFPFFSEPYRYSLPLTDTFFQIGNKSYLQERVYLEGISRLLSFVSKENSFGKAVFETMAGQTVLHNEYRKLITETLSDKALADFNSIVEAQKISTSRQLGLAPSFDCNLSCEYCFSKTKHSQDTDISLLNGILDWAAEQNVKYMRLYGGEPTHYQHFRQLVDGVYQRGMKMYFASNCIINKETLKLFSKEKIETIHAHIQGPENDNRLYPVFWDNVRNLSKKGIEIILRYNLMDQDWSFLKKEGEGFVSERLSFAPVVLYGSAKTFTEEDWKKQILLIQQFVTFIEDDGFTPVLARPQPLCFVEKNILEPRWDIFTGNCSAYRNNYMYNNLIWPDGSIALCDGRLRPEKVHLLDFKDWEQLNDFIREKMENWLELLAFSACSDCYYKKRALCQGSCLAAKNE